MSSPSPTLAKVVACRLDDLTPELGVAALFGDTQVAIFRLADDSVYAVQNLCPFSGASVLSRGITGSRGDVPTIASPIYKQVFSLVDGTCLATMDKEPLAPLSADLVTYPVTIDNGEVIIDLTGGT
ncbi:MAG: nitrite reductase (NAD(P)H) small subunit [Actinobacteria bacterium HGW-Actinobacteria-4]|nr:MAG: nitrite reductase (NAD(P)H) small subunit [Actinobacteria bacterium HGW-Actinobacteria-4]